MRSCAHHEPLNPLKWKECPYCDHEGKYLIEATTTTVAGHLSNLSDTKFDELITMVNIIKIERDEE